MDTTLLNSWLLWNSWWASSWWGNIWDVWMFVFNWYNLHNGTTRRVITSNHDDLWDIAFETYNYPRADWWNALGKYYRRKNIVLTLCLESPTAEWLNDLIDELKFQTSKTQWYLDIIINWIVRRWTATLTSLTFWRQSYNVNFLNNVTLNFECINPLAFTLNDNTKTYSQITGNYTTEIIYLWKVVVYPTIYAVMWSCNNLSNFSINTNWYLFTINHEINSWDVVLINWESKLSKINGTTIPYDWPFPAFEWGLNHIEISINSWASANYDLNFIYKDLYL